MLMRMFLRTVGSVRDHRHTLPVTEVTPRREVREPPEEQNRAPFPRQGRARPSRACCFAMLPANQRSGGHGAAGGRRNLSLPRLERSD